MNPIVVQVAIAAGATLISTVVSKLPDVWRAGKSQSLVEFTRPTHNEFLTVVEDNLVALPYMPDLMQSALSLVSGYYLSAVSLLVDIPKIDIIRTLDQLSSSRDPMEAFLGTVSKGAVGLNKQTGVFGKFVGTESFEYGLPGPDAQINVALEAAGMGSLGGSASKPQHDPFGSLSGNSAVTDGKQREQRQAPAPHAAPTPRAETAGTGIGRDTLATIKELSNLSVGKLLEVTMERDGNRAVVPVQMRLMVTNTDTQTMSLILSTASDHNTFKERYYRMKAGQLSFVNDLILCRDLISEARKTRVRDKSGFFEHMMRNKGRNTAAGMFSGAPSVNNASAIIVVSDETAKKAELLLGGKLSKFECREKLFQHTNAMLLFVVERKWGMVTVYHRSIETASTLSAAELKRANKSSGADVEDILRAYTSGSSPSL